jgi:hypothetical protein
MTLGKLLRTERAIFVYRKTKSSSYGNDGQKINVDHIPLEVLKTIVTPNNDDPLLYEGYILNEEQLSKFNSLLQPKIDPNHDKFDYALECYGFYENDSQSKASS